MIGFFAGALFALVALSLISALVDFRFWPEWRGNLDGSRCVMLVRPLMSWRGYKLDLHKFVGEDSPGCFHSHPAKAYRLILAGGYIEQYFEGRSMVRRPGYFGMVRPEDAHRIARLRNGRASWSLWFRFPKTHDVRLLGPGWSR